MQDARTIALPLVCWVWPIAQTIVLGLFFAIVSATSRTSASFMPVTLLDFLRRPLRGFLAHLVHAVDARP